MGRGLRPVLAAALLALPLLAALPTGAEAQTTQTFVSNTGQADGVSGGLGNDYAVAFTTGSNSAGYSLRSVNVEFADIRSGFSSSWLTASIHTDSSGSPGSSLGTLTNPGSFPVSNSDQTLTFTSTGIDLAANTTYFLVIDMSIADAISSLRLTGSDNEDSGNLSGWSIGDGVSFRSWNTSGAWSTNASSLKISLGGVVKIGGTPGITIGAPGQVEGIGSALKLIEGGSAVFTVVLDSQPSGTVTVTASGHSGTDVRVDTDEGTPGDQTSLTFTPSNWNVRQRVTLRAVEDADKADEAGFTLTFAATGTTEYATVTNAKDVDVSDNDVKDRYGRHQYTYTGFFAASTFVAREDAGFVQIEFRLSRALPEAVTLLFRYDDLTADSRDYRRAEPYVAGRTHVSVPAGQTNVAFRLPLANDKGVEENELVRIYLVKGPKYDPAATGSVQADIIITDPPYWTRENADGSFGCFGGRRSGGLAPTTETLFAGTPREEVVEILHPGKQLSVPPAGIDVAWDKASYRAGEDATVTFRTKDGKRSCMDVVLVMRFISQTAEEVAGGIGHFTYTGDDHPLEHAVRWQPVKLGLGETEVSVRVPLSADGRVGYRLEGGATGGSPVRVEGAAVPHWPTAWQWRTVAAPTGVSFARRTLEVRESTAGTVNLQVNIQPAATSSFNLDFTLEGTATPGTDYTIPGVSGGSGTVSVPSGATTATIPVTIVDDSIEDSGETIMVRLQASGGYKVVDPDRVTVTVLNHDPLPPAIASVDPALVALVRGYAAETHHGPEHVERWRRVLVAFGVEDYPGLAPMTAAEAQGYADRGWPRWDPVVAALKGLEAAPDTPGTPEIAVSGGGAVTEGGDAAFTLTATPAPAADLPVSVTVASDGDWGVTAGSRTVTIPTSGSATLTLATAGDDADEPDGSVSVTVTDGTGYTVGSSASGTVSVQDDDDPAAACTSRQAVADILVAVRDNPPNARMRGNAAHIAKWNRVLEAIGHDTGTGLAPMPASEIHANAAQWPDSPFKAASDRLDCVAQGGQDQPQQQDPEITVTADAAPVTEGGDAAFTIAASPAPAADLQVDVTVAATGDYGIAAGTQTVTIPTSGSATLTLATADDATDETDGSVTVTVADGSGWTAGDPASGTVAIRDDDAALPVVTLAAGAAVTEGGNAVFTLTASPAPAAALPVSVSLAADGDWGIAAGTRTVTIPTSGSATLTLATADDGTDEPDGSVTATVEAGSGYTVGASASGTVAVRDDDLPPPVVTIAAKAESVTEGGDAVFTLTADRAPDADLTVTLAVSETGDGDHVAAADEGPATVTIPKDATEASFTVPTVNDAVDEPDTSATVTVQAGNGYAAGDPASASVAVKDDDVPALPVLSVADETAKEGEVWLMPFTVRLSAPASGPVEVRVDTRPSTPVSAEPGPDYFPKPVGGHRLTFRAGETERTVEILILDDSHDEEAETFEFVLSDARGAVIGDGVAVGTIVNDDPMPAAWLARFGRTVAEQALDGIAGRMAAPRTPGMQGAIAGQAVGFGPTESGTPAAGGVPPAGGAPEGSAALAMADIARSFGSQAGHDPAGFGNGPGFMSAGPLSGTGGIGPGSWSGAGFGQTSAQSRTMTARDALLGSSFSLTGQRDGSGGSLAFWGRAAQGSFDGREGTFSLDGTVTTGMLGADYARGRWLIGLALAQSEGEGDYRDTKAMPRPPSQICEEAEGETPALCDGAVRTGDGKVEASLTAAIPYAAFQASERLKLWGAAGYGAGEVTLKTAMGGNYKADTSWSMAAAGMRGDLLAPPAEGSGPALAATSDALWTRTSSEKTSDLAASESDVTRLRVGLEGSYHVAMESGASLVPKLEVGARHDGGDAETGFGVELGGGIAWNDPSLGLSLDLSGRTLIAHGNDDLKDRGFSAALAYDPAPATQRGASLNLRQDFGGRATGGLDALFQPETLDDRTGSEATSRWAVEAAYGLPAFGGRWTGSPHMGFGLATAARDYSVGWRLAPEAANAPDLSFGVRATRRESDYAEPEHTFGVELTARW